MKNFLKIIYLSLITFFIFNNNAYSESVYFIDYSKILNQSKAGSEAQTTLKKKYETENDRFLSIQKNLKKEEDDLISQKKVLSGEEYQRKVEELRKKVSNLQTEKQNSLNSIAKSRNEARQELVKILNPIIKTYMEQNNIRIVLDKQSIVLGDTGLEITDKIIEILNKEVKSIKIK